MLGAIDGLPETEREAFDRVRIQGVSQAEAAQVLEVSVITVNRRLRSTNGRALVGRAWRRALGRGAAKKFLPVCGDGFNVQIQRAGRCAQGVVAGDGKPRRQAV